MFKVNPRILSGLRESLYLFKI